MNIEFNLNEEELKFIVCNRKIYQVVKIGDNYFKAYKFKQRYKLSNKKIDLKRYKIYDNFKSAQNKLLENVNMNKIKYYPNEEFKIKTIVYCKRKLNYHITEKNENEEIISITKHSCHIHYNNPSITGLYYTTIQECIDDIKYFKIITLFDEMKDEDDKKDLILYLQEIMDGVC